MRRILATLLAIPMLTSAALAQNGLGIPGTGRSIENHYFAVGLGFPVSSYPDNTSQIIENLESFDGVSRVPLDLTVGVYWPIVDNSTILGPALDLTADHLSRGDESISFNVMTLGASARRYFTGVIGEGLFGRIDAGIAIAGVSHRFENETFSENGNVGLGGTAGAGWAFAVSSGTSIELGATALFRSLPGSESLTGLDGREIFERGDYLAGNFSVAVLW